MRIVGFGALVCVFFVFVAASYAAGEDDGGMWDTQATPAEGKPLNATPEDLRLEPWWRERSDCGPLALFVMMGLQNERASLDDVKGQIHIDPERGCSLKDLQTAAERLGMTTEARFVTPRELQNVPGPFILHGVWSIEKNLGHFFVVIGYDSESKRYAIIDTTMARVGWLPEDTITRGYSGYILLPKHPLSRQWDRWIGGGLLFIGVAIASVWFYGSSRRKQYDQTQLRPAAEE